MGNKFTCLDREFPLGLSSSDLQRQVKQIAQSKRMDEAEVERIIRQAQTDAATEANNAKRKANGPGHTFSLC